MPALKLLIALAALVAGAALAMNESDPERLCQGYALEDGVPKDELAEYMAACVAELRAEATSAAADIQVER